VGEVNGSVLVFPLDHAVVFGDVAVPGADVAVPPRYGLEGLGVDAFRREAGLADVVPAVDGAADALADRIVSHATVGDDPTGTARRGYHAFIENVPGIVYRSSVDDLGAFESVYGRAAAVCGYSGDQLEAGLNWLDDVVYPNDRARVSRRLARAAEQGERFDDVESRLIQRIELFEERLSKQTSALRNDLYRLMVVGLIGVALATVLNFALG